MKRRLIISHFGGDHRAWLFKVTFSSRIAYLAVILLFFSFLIQPFHLALANEAAAEGESEQPLPDEVEQQDANGGGSSSVESNTATADDTSTEPSELDSQPAPEPDAEGTTEETTESDSSANESSDRTVAVDDQATSTDSGTSGSDTDVTDDSQVSTTDPINDTDNSSTSTTTDSTQDTATTTDSTASSTEPNPDSTATSTDTATVGGVDQGGETGTTTDPSTKTGTTTASTTETSTTTSSTTDPTNNDTNDVDYNPPDTDNNDLDQNSGDGSSTTTNDLIDGEKIEDGVNDLVDEVVNDVVNLTRQLVNEENYYQFSRQSCVPVGDGTFHCSTNTGTSFDVDSAIYAEQDGQGDSEIFMRTSKGEVKQITDNTYDDSSPDVHLASMQAVWQRLIDGRYQVISYDLETREETQLTFSRNNSMEPKISSEGIVWQAWDGNDWEIMFFDGQFTDQITDNESQDVTPVIEDGYILWSVLGGERAEARVYSIESKEMMSVAGHEGGSISNPRFVVVYDTKLDNGDIITQGFDPVTGLAEALSAKPADLPIDIPEPDPIGEIRALIQNKSAQHENEIIVVPASDAEGDLNLASSSDSSGDTYTVDVQPDADDRASSTDSEFELEEYDLVITDSASSSPSEINDEIHQQTFPNSTSTATTTSGS